MAIRKFCSHCGAPIGPCRQFCNQCGTPASQPPPGTGGIPAAAGAGQQVPGQIVPSKAPETLMALIAMIITGMEKNIRGMVRGIVKGMIIGFLVVLAVNILLQVTSLKSSDLMNSVLAVAGLNSSPNALLFWFLLTAILAFCWSQLVSRGLNGTVSKIASVPRGLGTSLAAANSTAFPLIMAGVAAALIIRTCLLTPFTSLQFFVLMFGIFCSQQESIAVLALCLGYSDLNRIIRKTGPVIPAPGSR